MEKSLDSILHKKRPRRRFILAAAKGFGGLLALGTFGCGQGTSDTTQETPHTPAPTPPYGCESTESIAQLQPDGSYISKINLRFKMHPTGVIIRPGDIATILSEGSGCWWPAAGFCGGPDKTSTTWGLYAGLRRADNKEGISYGYLGSNGTLNNTIDTACEILFFIPDPYENGSCDDKYYSDNNGYFASKITVKPNAP